MRGVKLENRHVSVCLSLLPHDFNQTFLTFKSQPESNEISVRLSRKPFPQLTADTVALRQSDGSLFALRPAEFCLQSTSFSEFIIVCFFLKLHANLLYRLCVFAGARQLVTVYRTGVGLLFHWLATGGFKNVIEELEQQQINAVF